MSKCSTKLCRRRKAKGRTICHTCIHEKQKITNPFGYWYQVLKANAKRRGKVFTLTLEQFKKFAIDTDYLCGKGKSKHSLSIDREDNDKGYTEDNIRILTLSENSKKKDKIVKVLHYDWETKYAVVSQRRNLEIVSRDSPF